MYARPERERSDQDIKMDIVAELQWDTAVDASKIEVRVDQGTATLHGTVPSWGSLRAAENDAWLVPGVISVQNQISVALPTTPTAPTSDTIAKNVQTALSWSIDVIADTIDVEIDNNVVTLTGSVATHREKMRAEEIAGSLRGVVAVKNELAVVPTRSISDEVVAEEVVGALRRNVMVNPNEIDVAVNEGVVVLSGKVPSYTAWVAANRAASHTDGVIAIQNTLTVEPD